MAATEKSEGCPRGAGPDRIDMDETIAVEASWPLPVA